MISKDLKCVFIHIPKTAGTSIHNALQITAGLEAEKQDHRELRIIEPKNFFVSCLLMIHYAGRLRREYVLKTYRNMLAPSLTEEEYTSFYKFTFVRNSWDRSYSWYKNVIRDPNHQRVFGVNKEIEFHEFLKKFSGKGALESQLHWIVNRNGEIPLDFIGKFHQLNQDYAILKALIFGSTH